MGCIFFSNSWYGMSQAALIQACLISSKYLAFVRKLGFFVLFLRGNCSKNRINDSVMGLWNTYPNLLNSVMIHAYCTWLKAKRILFLYLLTLLIYRTFSESWHQVRKVLELLCRSIDGYFLWRCSSCLTFFKEVFVLQTFSWSNALFSNLNNSHNLSLKFCTKQFKARSCVKISC